jgi:hypothetical protein
MAYMVCLHEIGHVATDAPPPLSREPNYKTLKYECDAWLWGIDHSILSPTERVRKKLLDSMEWARWIYSTNEPAALLYWKQTVERIRQWD